MRLSISILAALGILAAQMSSWGAQTVDLSVSKSGTYYYWFTYSDLKNIATTTVPSSFKDKKTTVDLPLVKDVVAKNTVLFVLNSGTGNEAIVHVTNQSPVRKIALKDSDFKYVRRCKIRIVTASGNAPVAACMVKLQSEDTSRAIGERTMILDPASEGTVEFENIPIGSAKVTVQYGEGKTASQDIDISEERTEIVPSIDVPVVGEVETIQASSDKATAKGPSGGGKGEEHQAPQGGTGVNFGSVLVGLALIAAILYTAGRILKKKGVGLQQALKNVGIDLPSDEPVSSGGANSTPATPADPTICPFCGGKKDSNGACACSISGGKTPAGGTPSQGARLVSSQGTYAGNIYPLSSDPLFLGREESNDLAFPQDISISRKHARLSVSGGEWTIKDEGSSNGTFVNGVKVTEQVLRPGDEIQIGSTRLRFEI